MFGNIDTKVRPIRLAYLVDPNNSKQVKEAIRLSSTLWGGFYFPIISLYKKMPATWREGPISAPLAKSVILGNIEAFDPDILVQLSKAVPAFIKEAGIRIIKPEEVWQVLDEGASYSPKFGLGIFELLDDIFEEHFKYKKKYPIRIVIPQIPRQFSLFWASLFGDIPPRIISLLQKDFFEPLEIESVIFDRAKLQEIMANNILFPARIVRHRLKQSNRSMFRRDASVYFCDATKTEDVIDFWNLRAVGKTVVPVPKQLQDDPQLKEFVIKFLKAFRRPWPHNPKVYDHASIIRARSCAMEEMQEYAKKLKIDRAPGDSSSDPFYVLQHWYPRIWDEWARDKDGVVPDDIYGDEEDSFEITDTSEFKIRFKPILPKFAQKYGYHGDPRCANEMSFRLYGAIEFLAEVFPKSSGKNFARAISSLTSFRGDWRVGRNGLVKLVKDDISESRDIPLSESIFFSWLADLDWRPKLSAPGLLAKQIYRKLEGNINVLKNEKLLGLLEHMNGGLVRPDGRYAEENKIGQERDLSIGEVKSRLETSPKRGDLHQYLLSKEVFKLGLRLQCPHCIRNSWFSLEAVRDTFVCPKCLNQFSAIGNVDNATWRYKTVGPFSVPNYADGAYAVLLALGFFVDRNITPMRTTPVLSFSAESAHKKTLEADFALLWQQSLFGEKKEGIIFGECKTYNKFQEEDFERMRYLAKTFPGAILVFSTLRRSLTSKEILRISRIVKAGRKYWKAERPINPVLVLTGTELLSDLEPPYCWDESLKNKFNRIHGLLEICDATQQIYLNLPSWLSDWEEKRKKRNQRRRKLAEKKNAATSQKAD